MMPQPPYQPQEMILFFKRGFRYLCYGCLAIVLFTILTSLLAYPFNKNMGRASYIDKKKRLDSIHTPKIIVVGGSNANYGFNSKLLQDSLQMPVVNMSLNANVSFLFFCNAIKDNINPGDIVLALPEYQFFDPSQNVYGNQNLYQLATIFPEVSQYFTSMQLIRAPLYLDEICAANIESIGYLLRKQPTESRAYYNDMGDFVGHQNKTTTMQRSAEVYRDYKTKKARYQTINKVTKEHLIAFHAEVKNKGATLILDWPVYSNQLIDADFPNIIERELHTLNWIGKYSDYVYDEAALYDSPYHLIYNYQNERTLKVIKDIKRWMNTR
jgi:hypothetical protein